MNLYARYIKRLVDIAASASGLIVLSPLLAATALWLHFANGGAGVFFTQARPGRGGRIFRILKFKTMNDRRSPDGNLLPDSERLTRAGRFVRSTSLDELPQLWNVLRGEMSLIGPRPLLPEYLPLYSPRQARRHEVRPGITGWAQCHGRNAISWSRKFELDVWYVDHVSFLTDCRILLATVAGVVRRTGISAPGAATMPPFDGTN